jgi:hypothetical protein
MCRRNICTLFQPCRPASVAYKVLGGKVVVVVVSFCSLFEQIVKKLNFAI